MVSVASATKRRAGLGTKKKAAKKAPRSRGATAASTVVVGAKLSMQNSTTTRTIQLAPPDASVSEKRRVAALISWEKRRAKISGARAPRPRPAAKGTKASKRKQPVATVNVARPVTPPKDKKRVPVPSAKRRKTDAANVPSRIGKEDAIEVRRKAAKLGWERRQRKLLAEAGDASTSAAAVRPPSAAAAAKKRASSKSKSAGGYSGAARRKAAVLGWAKRRGEKTTGTTRVSSSDTSSSRAPSKSKMPRSKPLSGPRTQGSKRSRRLASCEDSSDAHETEGRRMNELVTHLRLSRGWMEFRPSSRHGSGTATYGYIPSSIAALVRSGALSQRVVLERGTLGVHYALDWHGHGGLKEMIDRFGEDFGPHPTEDMIAEARAPEWELGDDLPWREVEAAEEERLRRRKEERMAAVKDGNESVSQANEEEDVDDILYIASILASLDGSTDMEPCDSKECKQGDGPDNAMDNGEVPSDTGSSPMLALQNYDGSHGYNSSSKICPLSHLADVTISKECKEKCKSNIVEEDIVIIPTPRSKFGHWNFGLC